MSNEATISRRGLFMKMGILFNGLVATALAVPIVGFVLSAITRGRANAYLSWVPLGSVNDFPEGETRLATFRNPNVMPTDGKTVDTACWVRRIEGDQFQVFAINCAHLGCPVRWFAQSGLFMCPCHGGGLLPAMPRASGPPGAAFSNINKGAERDCNHSGRRTVHSERRCGSPRKEIPMRMIAQRSGNGSTGVCSWPRRFVKLRNIASHAARLVGFMFSAAPR